MKPTVEQEKAQNRIHDLLSELVDLIGPRLDGDPDNEAIDSLADLPQGAVFLNEWALVAAWMDEDGHTFTTRWGSVRMPFHHLVGLLHEGLYGFGG